MLLKSIEINNCVQLLTNGISHFKWSPIDGMTGIMGSNGSGKSTVVRLASPLSGIREHFKEGGGVNVIYEHEGQEAEVGYVHDSGRLVHHFIVEGEELNIGGTGKAQDDLAEEFFGYVKTIHQCLTGTLRFSRLGPSKRAQLLQEVVSIDVSQAENLYNHLKSKISKAKANYSHVSDKALGLQSHVLKEEQMNKNKLIIDACSDALEFLRKKAYTNSDHSQATLYRTWQENNIKLSTLADKVLDMKVPNKPTFCNVDEELKYQLSGLVHKQEFIGANITTWSNEFLKVNESLVQQGVNSEDLEDTTRKTLSDLYVKRTNLTDHVLFKDCNNYELSKIESGIAVLRDWVNNEYTVGDMFTLESISQSNVTYVNNKYSELSTEVRELTSKKSAGELWLQRVSNTEKEQCPKCNHSYWKDFDHTEVERIKVTLANISTSLSTKVKELESLGEEVNELNNFLSNISLLYKHVNQLSAEASNLVLPLLEVNHQYSKMVLSKHLLVGELGKIITLSKEALEYRAVAESIDFNNQMLEKIVAAKQSNVYTQLSERSIELENLVTDGVARRELLTKQISDLNTYINVVDVLVSSKQQINSLLDTQLNLVEEMLKSIEYDFSESAYRNLQDKLATANEVISKGRNSNHLLESYMADMTSLDEEIKNTSKLMDALSPTRGLIAKELTNGINQFTNMMNSLLKDLWDYDMRILPCDLDKGKLTYRFPMEVKGVSGLKDIADGSDGQQQIIDFIFSILYISQKGLRDFPLILDEPGTGLDHAHLNSFFSYIKQLSDKGFCSQVFLISHVFGIMGDFADIDLVVLDEDNLTGLKHLEYNKNVTMF